MRSKSYLLKILFDLQIEGRCHNFSEALKLMKLVLKDDSTLISINSKFHPHQRVGYLSLLSCYSRIQDSEEYADATSYIETTVQTILIVKASGHNITTK